METLLWFAVLAGLFFLMMRVGCGSHVMGHGGHGGRGEDVSRNREKLRWLPPPTDIDPVCGKTVDTNTARSSVHDGTIYYFCSNECRERFEAAPRLYSGAKAEREPKQMEHSHD